MHERRTLRYEEVSVLSLVVALARIYWQAISGDEGIILIYTARDERMEKSQSAPERLQRILAREVIRRERIEIERSSRELCVRARELIGVKVRRRALSERFAVFYLRFGWMRLLMVGGAVRRCS